MKKCKYCRKDIEDTSSFCNYCGKRQDDISTTIDLMWADHQPTFAKLDVFMDGKLIAKAKWFKRNIINVPIGIHEFYVKFSFYQSLPLTIDCKVTENIRLNAGVIQVTAAGTLIRKLFGAQTMFLNIYNGPQEKNPLPLYNANIER